MVISAGLVPILLQLLTNKRVNQLKVSYTTNTPTKKFRPRIYPSNLSPQTCAIIFLERDKDYHSLGQSHLWIQHCIYLVLRL